MDDVQGNDKIIYSIMNCWSRCFIECVHSHFTAMHCYWLWILFNMLMKSCHCCVKIIKHVMRAAWKCIDHFVLTVIIWRMFGRQFVILYQSVLLLKHVWCYVIVVTWAWGICLICMPRTEGIHIRQIMRAHVTINMYHFRALLVCGRVLSSSSPIHTLLSSF